MQTGGPENTSSDQGQTPRVRLHEIDGLRGVAALNVVCFHAFVESFRISFPQVLNFWTSLFLNGGLDVSVFFVLSGDALSAAYFAGRGERSVAKLAVKRYPRLMIPVLAISLVIFAIIRCHLTFDGYAIVQRQDWLTVPVIAGLRFPEVLRFAFYDVFWNASRPSVDPFLWTMRYEMEGSLIVFFVLLIFRHVRFVWPMLLLIGVVMLTRVDTADLACFLGGIGFSAARQEGLFRRLQASRLAAPVSVLGMLVMLYGASGRLWPAAHMATFAIPLVFFIYCNRPLCDVLASAPCRFLGKISFPLYLVQFAVFISFTAWAIERAAAAQMLSLPVALAIAALSVAASLAAAWLFLPVERFTHRQGNWLARRMLASD